jgi:hypothetical protein
MSEYSSCPFDIPKIIRRKYPTVATPQVGILGEKQIDTHIEIEYIRKDIYNDLLKRVREAYREIDSVVAQINSLKHPMILQVQKKLAIGECINILEKHLPELEEK